LWSADLRAVKPVLPAQPTNQRFDLGIIDVAEVPSKKIINGVDGR
jgi:hypothetical protein